jgi:molybdate transport system regulatory protein
LANPFVIFALLHPRRMPPPAIKPVMGKSGKEYFLKVIMEIKFKIWLEKDGHALFGEGRDQLLKAIDECHGLYGAAKQLKMSYRAAWGKIKLTEERIGKKIVEVGDDKKMHLTKDARMLLAEFEKLEKDVDAFIQVRRSPFIVLKDPLSKSDEKK